MPKKKPAEQETRGRKPLAALGLERRDRKVVAAFTPTQYAALQSEAAAKRIPVATLVAIRAAPRTEK